MISEKRPLWFIAFGLLLRSTISVAKPDNAYHLPDYANDISILARLTNAFALGRNLEPVKIDLEAVSGELLNLGPNMTISVLESSGILELHKDLETISDVMQMHCNSTDGCANGQEDLVNVVSVFNKSDPKPFVDAMEALGRQEVKEVIMLAGNFSFMGSGHGHFVPGLINSLKNLDSASRNELKGGLTKVIQTIDSFKKTLAFDAGKTSGNIVGAFKTILFLEDFQKTFPNYKKAKTASQSVLKEYVPRVTALSVLFDQEHSKKTDKKLSFLQDFVAWTNRSYEKMITQGFPDGLNDIDRLTKDMESEFVKKIVGKGQSLEVLKKYTKLVTTLRTGLAPTQKSLDVIKFPSEVDVLNIRRKIEDASKELIVYKKTVSSMTTFNKCIEKLDFGKTFDFKFIHDALEHSGNLEQKKTDYSDEFATELPTELLENLHEIQKLLEGGGTDATLNSVKTFEKLDNVTEDLTTFNMVLKNAKQSSFALSLVSINSPLDGVKDWMSPFQMGTAFKCSKAAQYETLKSEQFFVFDRSQQKIILPTAEQLQKPIQAWKVFNKAKKTKREVQRVNSGIESLSKNLADDAVKIRMLAAAYVIRSDIQKLMSSSASIDNGIQGLSDKKEKESALRVWTDTLKAWFDALPDLAVSVDKGLPTERVMITSFESAWKMTEKLKLPNIDVRKLKEILELANNPPGTDPILQFVKSFHSLPSRQFDALAATQKLFDDVIGINRKDLRSSSKEGKEGGYNFHLWFLFPVVAVILVVVCCPLGLKTGFGWAKRKIVKSFGKSWFWSKDKQMNLGKKGNKKYPDLPIAPEKKEKKPQKPKKPKETKLEPLVGKDEKTSRLSAFEDSVFSKSSKHFTREERPGFKLVKHAEDVFGNGTCFTIFSASNARDINNPRNKTNNDGGYMVITTDSFWFDGTLHIAKAEEKEDEKTLFEPSTEILVKNSNISKNSKSSRSSSENHHWEGF